MRLAVALTSLLLALAGPARAGETITLVADEYCPFNCAPGTRAPGYMIELAQKIFAARGVTVRYEVMSWENAIAAARAGRADGVIAAAKDDVPDFVFPAQPLGLARFTMLVRKGDPWRYTGDASFEGKRIGVVEGYTFWPGLDAYLAKPGAAVRVTGADPLAACAKALALGKVDVVVEDATVVQYKTPLLRLDALTDRAGEGSKRFDLFIAFSPANPRSAERARILSEGVEALRKSGELGLLLRKYAVTDWK